jgi:ABC-type transport system involved in cytochrome c biogenesis permease component
MLMTVVSQLPLDFGTNLGALLTWVVLLLGGPTLSILGAIMVVGTIIIRTKEDRDRYKAVE